MKAIIFAAGLGTRLKPLTDNVPKALVKVKGKTLLEIQISKLKSQGFDDIIVNVHHFSNKIIDFLNENKNFGIKIAISDESGMLLDTGGGLKKAFWFFNDNNPFVAINVDILSDINLKNILKFHNSSKALVTLAVSERETSRYFLFNENNLLTGWRNFKTKEEIISRNDFINLKNYAFSGIQVVSPNIFNLINEDGKFSITNMYLRLCKENKSIAFPHNNDFWLDLGTPESINKAENYFDEI